MNYNGSHTILDSEGPSLEERLSNSILPRKAFEVYDLKEKMPINCTVEAIHIADMYLQTNGINKTQGDDATQWDIFWAREMVAARLAIADRNISYKEFLPGRVFMYELLADSIASLFNGGGVNAIKERKIAELGGGSGISLVLLAQRGAFVTNIDTSVMALKFSQYLAEKYGVEHMLDTKKLNFYDTGLEDNTFDVVYNAGVFEHLTDEQAPKLLEEMTRVVKPRGYVVVSIPNEKSPFYKRLQQEERSVYKKFKEIFVRLPWEEKRRTFDFRKLMEGSGLSFIKEDGLLTPPSQPIKKGTIPAEDSQTFDTYLPHGRYEDILSILSSWRAFNSAVSPEFRMKYGMSIYAVGQKNA